jgi:hypothetical protein
MADLSLCLGHGKAANDIFMHHFHDISLLRRETIREGTPHDKACVAADDNGAVRSQVLRSAK